MILDAIWVVDNSSIHIFEKWSPLMSGKWVLFSNSPKIPISLTSEYSIFQKYELICYLQPKWHPKSCETRTVFKKVARVPNPNFIDTFEDTKDFGKYQPTIERIWLNWLIWLTLHKSSSRSPTFLSCWCCAKRAFSSLV